MTSDESSEAVEIEKFHAERQQFHTLIGHCIGILRMSRRYTSCRNNTAAPLVKTSVASFDHLVSAGEQGDRHADAENLYSL
jgi:hypothetical protein